MLTEPNGSHIVIEEGSALVLSIAAAILFVVPALFFIVVAPAVSALVTARTTPRTWPWGTWPWGAAVDAAFAVGLAFAVAHVVAPRHARAARFENGADFPSKIVRLTDERSRWRT